MDDPGLELEGLTHREVEANGLRFHVAECGDGDRLALCLHGFPELWISWRHQMPLLARLGWPACRRILCQRRGALKIHRARVNRRFRESAQMG